MWGAGCRESGRNLDAVTRLANVNEVFEGAKVDGHGRLALRDVLRVLLEAHKLLVLEDAAVVDQLHAVVRLALLAA